MQSNSLAPSNGVIETTFTVADIPGALWTPAGDSVALVLMGHGGGLHKTHPALAARAHHYAASHRFTVAAIDAPGHGDRPRDERDRQWVTALHAARNDGLPIAPIVAEYNASVAERAVPEWHAVLDELLALPQCGPETPVGYTGMTMGTQIGIPLVATEPRIRAAVFGGAVLSDALLAAARRITTPVHYLLPWDDHELDRDAGLALFDTFGSEHKTLHAFPGHHRAVPDFEIDDSARFLVRHLT